MEWLSHIPHLFILYSHLCYNDETKILRNISLAELERAQGFPEGTFSKRVPPDEILLGLGVGKLSEVKKKKWSLIEAFRRGRLIKGSKTSCTAHGLIGNGWSIPAVKATLESLVDCFPRKQYVGFDTRFFWE